MGLKRLFNSVFKNTKYRLVTAVDYERIQSRLKADVDGESGGRPVTPDLLRILSGKTKPTVFDLGANQGKSYQLFRSLFPAGQIYCFEPDRRVYEKLQETIAQDPLAKLQPVAVSDQDGEIEFHLTPVSEMNSIFVPRAREADAAKAESAPEKVKVKSITLDRFAEENGIAKIDLLKMDIQGAEIHALKGASRMLGEFRIDCLYLELCFFRFYEGQPLAADILEYLRGQSYELYGLYNFQYDRKTNMLGYCDGLFIPSPSGKSK